MRHLSILKGTPVDFSLQPLGAYVGAEITGIDLRQPVSADTRAALNAA